MTETYEPPTTHVIPAKAGIYPRCVQTLEETALLRPSTEIDTIRQSRTNHNENSCLRARAREAAAFLFFSLGMDCAQVAPDSTYRLASPPPKHRANTSNGTSASNGLR